MIKKGYCHCGCGKKTNPAHQTYSRLGVQKGQPRKYLSGHNVRERYKNKINYIVDSNDCWVWQRHINDKGYGRIIGREKSIYAHRLYYEKRYGKIPSNLELDHLCRNTKCVNPDHLEAVTHLENVRRGNHYSKLTEEQVHKIRKLIKSGKHYRREIGEMFGVCRQTIDSIANNKTWQGRQEVVVR